MLEEEIEKLEEELDEMDKHTLILWVASMMLVMIFIVVFWMAYKEHIRFSVLEHDLIEDSKGYNAPIWAYVQNCSEVDALNQAKCITEHLRPIIRYNGSNSTQNIKSFQKFLDTGGTCKEIAVSYASAMRQLNWSVRLRSPVPKHISVTASKSISDKVWVYCDIELNRVNCLQVDNTEW